MHFSSGTLSKRPSYSLKWADTVVNSTFEKYPRGGKFFIQFTGLSREHLGLILARNRGEWHTIRRQIKNIDRIFDLNDGLNRDLDHLALNLYAMMEVFEINAQNSHIQTFADWARGLTARKIEIMLEEPEEKGGKTKSESDESSLPSLFCREVIRDTLRRRQEEASRKDKARREAPGAGE